MNLAFSHPVNLLTRYYLAIETSFCEGNYQKLPYFIMDLDFLVSPI